MALYRRLFTVPLMLGVKRNVRLRSLVVETHQNAKTTTNRTDACVFAPEDGTARYQAPSPRDRRHRVSESGASS
jgi:hypothetical protein